KLMVLLCAILMVIGFACQNESKVSRNQKSELHSLAVTPQEVAGAPVPPAGIMKSTAPQTIKDEEVVVSGYAEKKNDFNTEDYSPIVENKFLLATGNPLSTFSIDVDEASYSNVRRYLKYGSIPPAGAVRIEEMINYFDYVYPKQGGKIPFTVNTETGGCLWNTRHRLVYIGLQSREIPVENFTS